MDKKLPLLYTFIRCPWAMRARLALCYMAIEFEAREIDLKNKPRELLLTSPKGTVPVLVLPEGRVIEESLDIILWAMPQDPANHAEIMELIQNNDHEFAKNLNRYKYPDRYKEENLDPLNYRRKCCEIVEKLDSRLAKNKFLINDQVAIADLAIFPLLRQFSKVDEDWFAQAPYTNVQRWLDTISASDYYHKAMEKYPLYT